MVICRNMILFIRWFYTMFINNTETLVVIKNK